MHWQTVQYYIGALIFPVMRVHMVSCVDFVLKQTSYVTFSLFVFECTVHGHVPFNNSTPSLIPPSLYLGTHLCSCYITCGNTFARWNGKVVEPLALHLTRAGAEDIWHRGVGVLQPRHQPFVLTVALERVPPQVSETRQKASSSQNARDGK